jgi:hypothetical protein
MPSSAHVHKTLRTLIELALPRIRTTFASQTMSIRPF